MAYKLALTGNPNCGKTTLFNDMTGGAQHVGNWPGVTIEKKEGRARGYPGGDVLIVDLPGIYSLSPYSVEETLSRDYLLDEKPDAVIDIVDASNLERNLYLTTQVMELGVPVVVALNMMDVVEARGDQIDVGGLSRRLGVPVVPVSANRGRNTDRVVADALKTAGATGGVAALPELYPPDIREAVSRIVFLFSRRRLEFKGYRAEWVALRLLEDDQNVRRKLGVPEDLLSDIGKIREWVEKKRDSDIGTIVADARYRYIAGVVEKTVRKGSGRPHRTVSDQIDRVAINRVIGIPIFLLLMLGMFQLTFGTVGGWLNGLLNTLINVRFYHLAQSALQSVHVADWLISLICDGIITGVGAVLAFLPWIMILFLCLSLLEDCGYMARAAFLMDRLFRHLGLSGRSFIPMLTGFGCNVPAVLSAKTLENEKDRRVTIMITPFMSCSARLPIYALFITAFFVRFQALIVFVMYLLGIAAAVASAILFKRTVFRGEPAPFVMELPPYRLPTPRGLLIHMWERSREFVRKAGTIILTVTVVIWLLQSFGVQGGFHPVADPSRSLLGDIGRAVAPLFTLNGFADWKAAVALLTGFAAKEAVVSTMGILYNASGAAVPAAMQSVFTPLSAMSFMVFTLLYVPCLATVAAIRRELNSMKWTLLTIGYELAVAWLCSMLVYQAGRLLGLA